MGEGSIQGRFMGRPWPRRMGVVPKIGMGEPELAQFSTSRSVSTSASGSHRESHLHNSNVPGAGVGERDIHSQATLSLALVLAVEEMAGWEASVQRLGS